LIGKIYTGQQSFFRTIHATVKSKSKLSSVADPVKLFFFANEEVFRFFAGKLACLLHIEKIQ